MDVSQQRRETPAEADHVLNFLDDTSKASCFQHYRRKLDTCRDSMDLDALGVCITLLPGGEQVSS